MSAYDGSSPIAIAAGRTGFTRSHVRGITLKHRKKLGIRKVGGRWRASAEQIRELVRLVRKVSGPRYKLGEKGPHPS